MTGVEAFSYQSAPQPVRPSKSHSTNNNAPRYREDDPRNLMNDPRVVRGNTAALARSLALSQTNEAAAKSTTLGRAKEVSNTSSLSSSSSSRPTYEFLPKPFTHSDLSAQLTDPLEGLRLRSKEVASQVDRFYPRPPTPEYIPRKTGIDQSTQVEDVRELFDFDAEVQPILAVITQKTLEQALFELHCEEELDCLEKIKDTLEAKAREEAAWVRSKERDALLTQKTKAIEIQQREKAALEERRTRTYIAGLQMVDQLWGSMLEDIYSGLFQSNAWKDPVQQDIVKNFAVPSVKKAASIVSSRAQCEVFVDELLVEASNRFSDIKRFIRPLDALVNCEILLPNAGGAEAGGEPSEANEGGEGGITGTDSNKSMICFDLGRLDTMETILDKVRVAVPGIPWKATVESVKKQIIAQAGRDVALDARLLNFPLPDKLIVNISL